jgi:hypothetical protein
MLAEPGFWLIVAGGLLVGSGFIGLVFSRLGQVVHPVLDQMADDPVKLPVWFSTDKKAFGRATPKQTGAATAQKPSHFRPARAVSR